MDSDFNQLYAQLELRPDCTLDEFKRAYRRRVAELHPDRNPDATGQARDHQATALAELTSLYTTATRFHRAHGRLPGAASRHRVSTTTSASEHGQARSWRSSETAQPPQDEASAPPQRTRLAAFVIVLIVVLMVILEVSAPQSQGQNEGDSDGAAPGSPPAAARDSTDN